MLAADASIEEVREFFANDRFATEACGAVIEEASKGHAVCTLKLVDKHRNAMGGVMGGAIFTLADIALAVASNYGEEPTVGISNSIDFFYASRGDKLIATARVDRSGKRVGFYTIDVEDDLGTRIARMTAICSRHPKD